MQQRQGVVVSLQSTIYKLTAHSGFWLERFVQSQGATHDSNLLVQHSCKIVIDISKLNKNSLLTHSRFWLGDLLTQMELIFRNWIETGYSLKIQSIHGTGLRVIGVTYSMSLKL